MTSPTDWVSVQVQREADACVVHLKGSLCDDGTSSVREILMGELAQQPAHLVIDCAQVDYIASSGIGMLVSVLKKAHQAEGQLVLCGLNVELRELFALTRLDQVFPLASTIEEWRTATAS